jgi:DNA-binding response OmpR family regulator
MNSNTQHTVYIIEDDDLMRTTLTNACIEAGYSAVPIASGDAALGPLFLHLPSAILLDINLPGKSGLALLKEIRAHAQWGQSVPIIILTNLNTDNAMLEALVTYHPTYFFIKTDVVPADIIRKLTECISTEAARV